MLSEMEMMAAMGLPTSLGGKAVARPASAEAAGRRDPTAQCKAAAWADESERTCKRCARSSGGAVAQSRGQAVAQSRSRADAQSLSC